MKLLLTAILCIILSEKLVAQEKWGSKINDEWMHKYGIAGLKIGDTMPDIELGKVINNKTGKSRFAEFHGKLVILDYWNTMCSSCIENFPKMEKLQRQFGEQIQVFLVNPFETQERIESEIKRIYGAKIIMPDLPSIVADRMYGGSFEEYMKSPLYKLFPNRGVPHHVWIDQQGVVRIRGVQQNTYPEKISDLLSGKDVYSMKSLSTTFDLGEDGKTTYMDVIGDFTNMLTKFGSLLTPYNNDLSASIGGLYIEDKIDSVAKNIRSTFLNVELLDLYFKATQGKFIFGRDKGVIYGPDKYYGLVFFPGETDTLDFTSGFVEERIRQAKKNNKESSHVLKETDWMKSRFCYEQVLPYNIPGVDRRLAMLADLNRYLFSVRGETGQVERRKLPCYILVRKSDQDKIKAKPRDMEKTIVTRNSMKYTEYISCPLSYIIHSSVQESPELSALMTLQKFTAKPFLIVDETGWDHDRQSDMIMPVSMPTIDDFRKALWKYDLDLVEAEREINALVFDKRKSVN